MNTVSLFKIVFCATVLFGSSLSGAVLALSEVVQVDKVDSDATFQNLPDVGKEKYLCLWSGDQLQAFLMVAFDKTKEDWKGYIRITEKGMKKEGARNVSMRETATLKSASGLEVKRFEIRFISNDADVRQLYYAVKTASGYHAIVVTLTEPSSYDSICSRVDKLIETVVIKG